MSTWSELTPDQILADVNAQLMVAWSAQDWAFPDCTWVPYKNYLLMKWHLPLLRKTQSKRDRRPKKFTRRIV